MEEQGPCDRNTIVKVAVLKKLKTPSGVWGKGAEQAEVGYIPKQIEERDLLEWVISEPCLHRIQ